MIDIFYKFEISLLLFKVMFESYVYFGFTLILLFNDFYLLGIVTDYWFFIFKYAIITISITEIL